MLKKPDFLGSSFVIGLFLFIILRLISIAAKVKDYLGSLIIIGVATLFLVQTFINIGMTIGIVPVTGLPLPFISAGGSTLWSSLTALGVVF